jgi:hypothetical protein
MKTQITNLEEIETIQGVPEDEKETHINFLHMDHNCVLYTRDNTMVTKMKRCMAKNINDYQCYVQKDPDGTVVSYEFIFPKKYLRFATKSKELSEEQRKFIGERLCASRTK